MRIYLDNCCYNRPYDDQTQLRISLETQAKLEIQRMIREKKLELVASYVLLFENSRNPHETRRNIILDFVKENISSYVDVDRGDEVKSLADGMIASGIKTADAHHLACAIIGGADYFLTTDNRLLKFNADRITPLDPVTFIRQLEELS